MHNIRAGIFYIVLSTIVFALVGVFVKLINGVASVYVELFSFSLFNFLFLLIDLTKKFRETFAIESRKQLLLISARNIFGLASFACTFFALKYMTVTNAVLLNNTATLFVPLVVLIVLKVNTSFKLLIGSLVGFIGVIFVLHPGPELFTPAALIGLAAGLFGGIGIVMVREASKISKPNKILLYYSLTGMVVFGIFLPYEDWSNYQFSTWMYLLGVGIWGALYQIFFTHSLKNAPARLISSFAYLTLVFTGLFDWIFWHVIPDFMSVIGIFLVISGGILTIYLGKDLSKGSNDVRNLPR